jgi:hypothetical protein
VCYVLSLSVADATQCHWQLNCCGKILTGESRNSVREDVLPLLLCPADIPHGLACDRTLAFCKGLAMKHLSHGMDRCWRPILIQSVFLVFTVLINVAVPVVIILAV